MNRPIRLKPALMACAAGLSLLAAQPAFAQTVDSTKLLELMVAKGLVTREEADGLLAQATVAPTPAPIPAGGVANGVQTIPYIPQVVRDQIKEELRTVPNKGLGFGALRYLGTDADQQRLRSQALPCVTFNYLGQFDASFDQAQGALFVPSSEAAGTTFTVVLPRQ